MQNDENKKYKYVNKRFDTSILSIIDNHYNVFNKWVKKVGL